MITIKKPHEFEKMAAAGRCVAAIHRHLKDVAAPGITTAELDAMAAKIMKEHDCTPSFLGYHGFPGHICASPNEVIVHGIPGSYALQEGDIFSLDVGAIYDGWHADAALTFAIGEVSPTVETLLVETKRALWEGIRAVEPGARTGDIGAAVEAVGEANDYGIVREYVGHGIGRAMHEQPQVPNYGQAGVGTKLKTGMAICIEPMFNLGGADTLLLDDDWTVVTADGSLSAHFEHTVALTQDGLKVLTAAESDLSAGLQNS